MLRLSWGPFLHQSEHRKQINATYLYPSAANGLDQLMFMHCFEDVSILLKVCIHPYWQTIFSTKIALKLLYEIQCNRERKVNVIIC